ncbi:MAG TPA: DUF2243 domain-containing protein [Verrucomicrobiae bacterium]|nr:DUF2243 domain-containing protein [Verrucomicrobiae bacterium]
MNTTTSGFKPLIRSGIFLGIGLGGFFDGIVFHQLLQLHSMMTARLPKDTVANVEVNMFWDGLFHAFTWTMSVIGLILLWRAVTRHRVPLSTKCFVGSMLLGWGLFNFIEGLIDHHILHLHHVVERLGVSVFDYAFLGSGVILILVGWAMVRTGKKDENLLAAAHATRAGAH